MCYLRKILSKGLDKAAFIVWLQDRNVHYTHEKEKWLHQNKPEEMCMAKGKIAMINEMIEKMK